MSLPRLADPMLAAKQNQPDPGKPEPGCE